MTNQTSHNIASKRSIRIWLVISIVVVLALSACENTAIVASANTPLTTTTTISATNATIISTSSPNATITSDQLTPVKIEITTTVAAPTIVAAPVNQNLAKWEYAQLIQTGKDNITLELPNKEINDVSLQDLADSLTGGKENVKNVTDIINLLGSDGWELVSNEIAVVQKSADIYGNTSTSYEVWIFKRQK